VLCHNGACAGVLVVQHTCNSSTAAAAAAAVRQAAVADEGVQREWIVRCADGSWQLCCCCGLNPACARLDWPNCRSRQAEQHPAHQTKPLTARQHATAHNSGGRTLPRPKPHSPGSPTDASRKWCGRNSSAAGSVCSLRQCTSRPRLS
jgi:hypothetical protein